MTFFYQKLTKQKMTIQGYNLSAILNGIVKISNNKITLINLLQDIGLAPAKLEHKKNYLDWIFLAKALEKAILINQNPYIGFELGKHFSPIGLGPEVGFFLQVCPDLRAAAIAASEHTGIVGGVTNIFYQENAYDFFLGFNSLNEWKERFPESYRVCAELNVAIIYNIATFLTQGIVKPHKIIFEHEEIAGMKEIYQSALNINISIDFGKKANGAFFYTEKMKTPNPSFDTTVFQNYQIQVKLRENEVNNNISIAKKVKLFVRENLFSQHKDITLEDTAAHFFTTPRALQRAFEKENTSWNELKNELRKAWIKENVFCQSDQQLADFLFFSNIQNFKRWFKTQFEMSINEYRRIS